MLKTNENRLVMVSVMGEISHPTLPRAEYRIGADGSISLVPGVGGISFNCRVGDPAVGIVADHIEPGVSIRRMGRDSAQENAALNSLACVGNAAVVITGDAKGATGAVTGKHGGIEHVLVDFPESVMQKMAVGDRIQVFAFGAGLELTDFPDVRVLNCDPRLIAALKLKPLRDGRVEIPVALEVPARIMGSGLGANTCHRGDYDIQLFDPDTVREFGLAGLRLGDLVAIRDADHSFGRIYRGGAVSVGVVVHSDSAVSGHGPGVTTLFTSTKGRIAPRIDPLANLADRLGLRAPLRKKKPR